MSRDAFALNNERGRDRMFTSAERGGCILEIHDIAHIRHHVLQVLREDLNFLITNRIPRRLANRWARWFTRIENRTLTRLSIPVWSYFAGDLALHEARETEFASLHDCFTRQLKPGARTVDRSTAAIVSPCDGEIGAFGRIDGSTLIQAKGLTYSLDDLLGDSRVADKHRGGLFLTLRLRSSMYHRFHAPDDATLRRIRFIAGDTWNVNPIAVKRIERLFCRNERVVLELELHQRDVAITLVPVAAILVGSIRVHSIPFAFDSEYGGSATVACNIDASRGDELGYFENGSTVIVLASGTVRFADDVRPGATVQMGQPLLQRTDAPDRKTPSPTIN